MNYSVGEILGCVMAKECESQTARNSRINIKNFCEEFDSADPNVVTERYFKLIN
jgi:hypothetical protein